MPQITLAHGTVAYTDEGPADAPVVVFVHGYAVDGGLWRETADALPGLRRIRPTLPLGAHTVPAGRGLTAHEVAALVADLLEALDLHDVTLVGNDSGGAISQLVVDRHPERVGRLVLTNCDAFEVFPPKPFDLLVPLARRGLLRPLFRAGTPVGALHRLFALLTTRGLDRAQVDAWARPYLTDPVIAAETDVFVGSIDPPLGARLDRFEGPVLLVWGMRDRFFTPALGRRLEAAFRDARFVGLPEARTFVPHDEPARLAELIEEHVRVAAVR